MREVHTDIAVVGSGAGGATVAKELAEHGRTVLILEKGEEPSLKERVRARYNEGTLISGVCNKLESLVGISKNVGISRRIGIGGTTTIASANAVRSLEEELCFLGADLTEEFGEMERELGVTPFPRKRMGKGARSIWDAANALGFKFEPIRKCVDFDKCTGCNKCNIECPTNAKWTALDFIKQAQDNGASLLRNVAVQKLLTSNGSVAGLKALSRQEELHVRANVVVLAAGALATPVLLRKTAIERAGKQLFCHPCYIVYDAARNNLYDNEPRSIINSDFLQEDGFTLLNHVARPRTRRSPAGFFKSTAQEGMLGVLVKIKDDPVGCVNSDGSIRKTLTSGDLLKVEAGIQTAKDILKEAGVDRRWLRVEAIGGYHPGGTAAIGEVVDQNQQTPIENLFVSDASVLPNSSGLPPLLTIMALSKRLAKRIAAMT